MRLYSHCKKSIRCRECVANGISGYLVDNVNDVIRCVCNDLKKPLKSSFRIARVNPHGHQNSSKELHAVDAYY